MTSTGMKKGYSTVMNSAQIESVEVASLLAGHLRGVLTIDCHALQKTDTAVSALTVLIANLWMLSSMLAPKKTARAAK